MTNLLRVTILHSFKNLSKIKAQDLFWKEALDQIVKQLKARAILHNQVGNTFSFDNFPSDDRMLLSTEFRIVTFHNPFVI